MARSSVRTAASNGDQTSPGIEMEIRTIKGELQAKTRQDLIKRALELKIPGCHQKKKQELIEEIAITSIYQLLPRSPQIIRNLTRRDLLRLCEMGGIKVKRRSLKSDLVRAVKKTLVKKQAAKRPESPRPEAWLSAPELPTMPEHFPDSYDVTRVVLLPVDLYRIHVYWDIAKRDLERVRNQIGKEVERAQATLRFYDTTHIFFDGTNAHSSFDVDINLQAGNWYVHLWSPGRSYCMDLGFRTGDGRFFPIVRSNMAEMPPAHPSEKGKERYMLVSEDFKRLEIMPQLSAKECQKDLTCHPNPETISGVSESQNPEEILNQPVKQVQGKVRNDRYESFPMDMDKVLQEKLAELYRFRLVESPRPPSESGQVVHSASEEADLTEMNERGLTAGISSKVMILRKEKDLGLRAD